MASDSNAAAGPSESTAANAVHGPFTPVHEMPVEPAGQGML